MVVLELLRIGEIYVCTCGGGAGSKKCVPSYYNQPIAEPDKTMMGSGYYTAQHLHPSAPEYWFPM